MYADRYATRTRFSPASLAVAVGINAAVVTALVLSNPAIPGLIRDRPLETVNIPLPPVPPPEIEQPKPQPEQRVTNPVPERPDISRTIADRPADTDFPPLPPLPPLPPIDGTGAGTGAGIGTQTVLLPVLVAATVDPRHAAAMQPAYPPSERRAEREGIVRLKVLIGVDGRVRAVERIDATSDDFYRVTERQALSRWRFTPATRDGVPYESWKTMSVRFRLDNG